MHRHQRTGRDARSDVVGRRAGLVGDQRGERVGVAGDDLPLPREQGTAVADDPRGDGDPLPEIAARPAPRPLENEPAEGVGGNEADGQALAAMQALGEIVGAEAQLGGRSLVTCSFNKEPGALPTLPGPSFEAATTARLVWPSVANTG